MSALNNKYIFKNALIILTLYVLLGFVLIKLGPKNPSIIDNSLHGNTYSNQSYGINNDKNDIALNLPVNPLNHPILPKVNLQNACYAHLNHDDCLNFPEQPPSACSNKFTYHGLVGFYRCKNRPTD